MKRIIISILVLVLGISIILFLKNESDYIVGIENDTGNYLLTGNGITYKYYNNRYYIVTNYHIVANSKKIYIYNKNGKKSEAKLENYDDYSDIAILSTSNKLKTINLTNCTYDINDKIRIKGYNIKKRGYLISKLEHIDVPNSYGNSVYDAMKLEYDIDYGDSGSAVINRENKVIGLLSVMDKETKEGYAIPICDVLDIVDRLSNNSLNRPNLRAQFTNSKTNIKGVIILNIYDNSLLSEINLQENDIITKINDINIENVSDFRNELYKYSIGDNISFEYYRDGVYYNKTCILK